MATAAGKVVGRLKPESKMRGASSARVLHLKIKLLGVRPEIWRRVIVRDDTPLDRLHEIFQVVMGWTNSHLHAFVAGGSRYEIPDDEGENSSRAKDEGLFTLGQLVKKKGAKFSYEYDFGDRWIHEISVEDVSSAAGVSPSPRCLAGARACPPEDVGGVSGYENFLAAIGDPKHPEHGDLLAWAGGNFDSEAFSTERVNREIELWSKYGFPADWGNA